MPSPEQQADDELLERAFQAFFPPVRFVLVVKRTKARKPSGSAQGVEPERIRQGAAKQALAIVQSVFQEE